ncbi:hypothetical protein AN958_09705 [Leucoagaricus sp. SymC.cos]|nr:hypothetical protein AN958_09705 [Leucoagaricus sp. SymC.cos]
MGNDVDNYQRILTRLKSTKAAVLAGSLSLRSGGSTPVITGLGSGYGGRVLTEVLCANVTGRGTGSSVCPNAGVLICSQCKLVKVCTSPFSTCTAPLTNFSRIVLHRALSTATLVTPSRPLRERTEKQSMAASMGGRATHPEVPIRLIFHQSGLLPSVVYKNYKLCFPGAGSLSQLIRTVNSLPRGFEGQCDILLNHVDAVVINRHLIILYALLRSGRDIEESAELATHLMYSAFLTPPSAEYFRTCVEEIYGVGPREGDMSFYSTLETRGLGKLHTMQTTTGIKRPVEMATSTYGLTKARRGLHNALLHSLHLDDRERHLMKLKPAHRLTLSRFWETGVLSPVFLNTASFNQPNRLHFSPHGEWLGHTVDMNPLQGWDITSVQKSGTHHGLEASDIFGCLFFHIKSELTKFARRLKYLCVNIYFTQFDVRVLSTGICSGLLPVFEANCFDRVDAGGLMDALGMPCAIARGNPRLLRILMTKAKDLPELERRLRKAEISEESEQDGSAITSTSLLRMIDFLDAFVDHEGSFQAYLDDQNLSSTCESLGFKLRQQNYHYPKRSGIGMEFGEAPEAKMKRLAHVPGLYLTKEEFYDLFLLGGAELPTRFIEFEPKRDDDVVDRSVYTRIEPSRRFSM